MKNPLTGSGSRGPNVRYEFINRFHPYEKKRKRSKLFIYEIHCSLQIVGLTVLIIYKVLEIFKKHIPY